MRTLRQWITKAGALPDWVWIVVLVTLFIFLRSLHFTEALNFSQDQGLFSIEAVKIWSEKKVVLIGPTFSINVNGRYAFQGSLIYYFQLLFLWLSNFQPVPASFMFVVWGAVSVIPLYVGTKWWLGKLPAILLASVFVGLPFYLAYTRFLWNPNFQLTLVPWILLAIGQFHRQRSWWSFGLIGILLGITLQFHYQFGVVVLALLYYYFSQVKLRWPWVLLFLGGLALGVSNLLLFELRNHFYNLQTVWLFLQQFGKGSTGAANFTLVPHYFLTLSFWGVIALTALAKKYLTATSVLLTSALLVLAGLLYVLPKPSHGFGMVDHWSVADEEKVYQLIRAQNLDRYNVTNLAYDTKAAVQKYFHLRDRLNFSPDDYTTIQHLFVISPGEKFTTDPAYELREFQPAQLRQSWPINSEYTLYLLDRQP